MTDNPRKNGELLFVVFKVAEQCVLDCDYCYFFKGADRSYIDHPAVVEGGTIDKVNEFLRTGCKDLGVSHVCMCLHGGEPLLLGHKRFDRLCSTMRASLGDNVELSFTVQTNGVLVDRAWVELFKKHDVNVGISLDGPKDYHDKHRVDKLGRGTYDRVLGAIQLLKEGNLEKSVGTLSVIDPSFSPEKIYRCFVDTLGLDNFDFLLFDGNYDNYPPYDISCYRDFLINLFDVWVKDDNTSIKIRYFDEVLNLLGWKIVSLFPMGPKKIGSVPMITIASDGSLLPVDEYAYSMPRLMKTDRTVMDTSLKDFIELPLFDFINKAENTMPIKCNDCFWSKICCGGPLQTRYSSENGFLQPSIYCDCFSGFFAHVASYMVTNGYSKEKLYSTLSGVGR